MTLLFEHAACLEHDTGHGHPESADRLRALLARLEAPEFDGLGRRPAPRAERAQLSRVHEIPYISRVYATAPESGEAYLAPDVILSPGTLEASLRAAGAVCAAVDAVAAGEANNAFCAVRPPGHHAATGNSMGFCVFNNVAVGAAHARVAHGYGRVAVIDFDVHHGNGTEAIFRRDPTVFVGSIHQSFIFPKSGDSSERGVGNIVNVPLARRAGSKEFGQALDEKILPALRRFAPEFILVAAGFDAHVRDPVGDLRLRTADYKSITESILAAADDCCGGRIVSVLEGGYDPEALADAGAAHLRALMQGRPAALSAARGAAAAPLSPPDMSPFPK